MTKGTPTKRRKGGNKNVVVDGPWLAVPLNFLASRSCQELSPAASKLLFGCLLSQLKPGGGGNGRLDLKAERMRANGWTSNASVTAAIKELIDADLLVLTRRGAKGRLALYGVTLYPMFCDSSDLEIGPGAWTLAEWRSKPDLAAAPTLDKPARWSRARADEKRDRCTRSGGAMDRCAPAAGVHVLVVPPCPPAAGEQTLLDRTNAHPPRVSPSRDAICTASTSAPRLAPSAKLKAVEAAP